MITIIAAAGLFHLIALVGKGEAFVLLFANSGIHVETILQESWLDKSTKSSSPKLPKNILIRNANNYVTSPISALHFDNFSRIDASSGIGIIKFSGASNKTTTSVIIRTWNYETPLRGAVRSAECKSLTTHILGWSRATVGNNDYKSERSFYHLAFGKSARDVCPKLAPSVVARDLVSFTRPLKPLATLLNGFEQGEQAKAADNQLQSRQQNYPKRPSSGVLLGREIALLALGAIAGLWVGYKALNAAGNAGVIRVGLLWSLLMLFSAGVAAYCILALLLAGA